MRMRKDLIMSCVYEYFSGKKHVFGTLVVAVSVMFLVSSCGVNAPEQSVEAVEDWTPFVQTLSEPAAFVLTETAPYEAPSTEEWLVRNYGTEIGQNFYNSMAQITEVLNFVRSAGPGSDVRRVFGGAEINPESGSLYVNILDSEAAHGLIDFLLTMDDVVIRKTEFTRRELARTALLVRNFLGASTSVQTWVGTDEEANRVYVIIREYTDAEKEYFRRELFDSPMLTFRAATGEYGWSSGAAIIRFDSFNSSPYWRRRSFNEM